VLIDLIRNKIEKGDFYETPVFTRNEDGSKNQPAILYEFEGGEPAQLSYQVAIRSKPVEREAEIVKAMQTMLDQNRDLLRERFDKAIRSSSPEGIGAIVRLGQMAEQRYQVEVAGYKKGNSFEDLSRLSEQLARHPISDERKQILEVARDLIERSRSTDTAIRSSALIEAKRIDALPANTSYGQLRKTVESSRENETKAHSSVQQLFSGAMAQAKATDVRVQEAFTQAISTAKTLDYQASIALRPERAQPEPARQMEPSRERSMSHAI
jgi:hypothetical protein